MNQEQEAMTEAELALARATGSVSVRIVKLDGFRPEMTQEEFEEYLKQAN